MNPTGSTIDGVFVIDNITMAFNYKLSELANNPSSQLQYYARYL